MTSINNDAGFRAALENLDIPQQRAVAARFVENVLVLFDVEPVKRAIGVAANLSAAEDELQLAYKNAKAASVESYARCGADGDWRDQAGHFVAKAAAACVSPTAKANLAWEVAMQCRMACTCEGIAQGTGSVNTENEAQYKLLAAFV